MASTSVADIRTSAGSQFFVSSSAPATYDSTGFGALTWTEVKYISNLGEFGAVYNSVKFLPLATRTTVKRKGSLDNGTIAVTMARVGDDAGQALLMAATNSDLSYSYKLVTQDGSTFFFSAQAMSYKNVVGSVDSVFEATCTLEVDNSIIEI